MMNSYSKKRGRKVTSKKLRGNTPHWSRASSRGANHVTGVDFASPEDWSEHARQLVNQVPWQESCAHGRLCAQGVLPNSVEPITGQTLGCESRRPGFNTRERRAFAGRLQ